MLVELEAGKKLDARHDPGCTSFVMIHHLVENAVDAVADEGRLIEDLNMNIGRARRERVGKDVVHDGDDRQVGRRLLHVLRPVHERSPDIVVDQLFEILPELVAVHRKSAIQVFRATQGTA